MRFKWIGFLLMLVLAPAGCRAQHLKLTLHFDQIHGLQADDTVWFERNRIGTVTRVHYVADGFYAVNVKIKPNFRAAATEHARFYIVSDPRAPDRRAVEMMALQTGGQPLRNGQVVKREATSAAMLGSIQTDFEQALDKMLKQLEILADELRRVPQSEAYRQLQEDLRALAARLSQAGEQITKEFKQDVLPGLKEELEKLKERLRRFDQEEKARPLEEEIERLEGIAV